MGFRSEEARKLVSTNSSSNFRIFWNNDLPSQINLKDDCHEKQPKCQFRTFRSQTEIDGSPAVLLYQESPGKRWTLPGAVLKDGESETYGLKQALTRMLLSPDANELNKVNVYEWEVGECLTRFWGTRYFNLDTYVPYAITGSQLLKKLFLVRLPALQHFFIPVLASLKAFKLQGIHSNLDEEEECKFDPMVAGVPLLVSKFSIASSTNTNLNLMKN